MAKPAGKIAPGIAPQTATGNAYYELPLSERMRTFLRLEFLYQQMLYNCEDDSGWATRATITTLLEILAILSRGDVRGEVHKELDHQINTLQRFQSQPGVDTRRLDTLIRNLLESRGEVNDIGTQFLQPLKDSEFLPAIQHRNSIPGGTCEFDLPEYNHWLKQPYARREEDLAKWISAIRPLCDAVVEVLWLIRESGEAADKTAINGMYQHSMQKDICCRLLRVILTDNSSLYPEISGSQHRFTVRFLEWSTIDSRAVQTGHDVKFQLSIC
jgi:cell division protein ZapD